MVNLDSYPASELLRKRKGLRRQLLEQDYLQPLRIAVLGGSTANEVADLLELFLLASGFKPTFHLSGYGRFYEDAVLDRVDLIAFAPDLVYVYTTHLNGRNLPPIDATEEELQRCVDEEITRFRQIWDGVKESTSAQIIQNNFDHPEYAILGNLDPTASGGASRFFGLLNAAFSRAAAAEPRLLLADIHRLSAEVGLRNWFDRDRYLSYKVALSLEANVELARSLNSIVRAIYGKSRKVLVLDLDNTLWGGVIGDDGPEKIQIGRESAVAEAYTSFQEYCLALRRRGVVLAVCSKNTDEVARQGFALPDSVLKLEDITCFKANWAPKHENILAIAKELNLGVDSFVFVDDNPAERSIVAAQIPGIAVPDVGNEVSRFASIIEAGRYFEPVSMSTEDLSRSSLYQANAARSSTQGAFANYGEYLDSLQMQAEIAEFEPRYMERIAQLTNKTNQFNLTTRRYTLAEMEAAAADPTTIALYGRLVDRFGDNGLVSVVLGTSRADELHVELWLMSCRVLKRDMENAMLDALVERSRLRGVRTIYGYYLPTKKNGMVADHYEKLGFTSLSTESEDGASVWMLRVDNYQRSNHHIEVKELIYE